MGNSGVILGDWTHRRADVGGARAVAADVAKARPRIAWTFRPPHAGNVDQVRIASERVYVATTAPVDPTATGWEHATVYAIDASSGRVVAMRALPDPVPVAAMIVEGALVHILATRHGEPVFWYVLDAVDLRPRSRRALALDRAAHWDVLEAWASADGGLWMELEASPSGRRTYAFAMDDTVTIADRAGASPGEGKDEMIARDACCVGHTLYAPCAGEWDDGNGTPPSIWQLDPSDAQSEPWARTEITGPRSRAHALAAEGAVSAIAIAVDPEKERRAVVQALAIDRATGTVRAQSPVLRLATRGVHGDSARLARRPNGDILFSRSRARGSRRRTYGVRRATASSWRCRFRVNL